MKKDSICSFFVSVEPAREILLRDKSAERKSDLPPVKLLPKIPLTSVKLCVELILHFQTVM